MSDLRTRIAAVLHQHLLAVLDDDWITCRCDDYLSRFTTETYERHVADAVIRELGLRQEWGALDDTDGGFIYDTAEEARPGPQETVKTRYVTEWNTND